MKTKNVREAYMEMISILDSFEKMSINHVTKMNATVENVGFSDMIILFHWMGTDKKQIYLPGELNNENITIIYNPAPGCVIAFESEPCLKLIPKINLMHMN